ncbi:MAG TPA: creatininase family protein [Bacillota bacterium]|nr:creatininase family protein [Bacillota bacterium]
MGYSIFEETMADMTWVDIEKASTKGAIVLFPLGVIEEHGPHLCLGTDIYLSYNRCKQIKKKLDTMGIKALVTPPYYWGVNNITGGFPGSFTVRKETLKNIIYDLLACLHRWGFKNIFCFYGHGDTDHVMPILESIRESRNDHQINARMVVEDINLKRFKLSGNEEYILSLNPSPSLPESDSGQVPIIFDIHAGSFETAAMNHYFPRLVKVKIAKTLKSTDLNWRNVRLWSKGWDEAKKITPLGYVGDPANYEKERDIKAEDDKESEFTANRIAESLQKS